MVEPATQADHKRHVYFAVETPVIAESLTKTNNKWMTETALRASERADGRAEGLTASDQLVGSSSYDGMIPPIKFPKLFVFVLSFFFFTFRGTRRIRQVPISF